MKINRAWENKTPNKFPRSELDPPFKPNTLPIGKIWHETASPNFPPVASGTLNYNLGSPSPGTSYNDLIGYDGTYYPYVDGFKYVSYHAGVNSSALGYKGWGVNVMFLGTEIDGPNNGKPASPAQLTTINELIDLDWARHGIPRCDTFQLEHGTVAPYDARGNVYKTDPKCLDIRPIVNARGMKLKNAPRITRAKFARVLEDYGSPALPHADRLYDVCTERGFDPGVMVGIFMHESKCGTLGIAKEYQTFNWGNVRTPFDAARGSIIQTPRGGFVRFPDWETGLIDLCDRLEHWYINDWKLPTVETMVPKYAPSFDGNSPLTYIRTVVRAVEKWAMESTPGRAITNTSGQSVNVPNEVYGYWEKSGGVWQPDRYALGLLTNIARVGDNELFEFERGRLRLKKNGGIDALLLGENG